MLRVWSSWLRAMTLKTIRLALLPSLVVLLVYYSLALHMWLAFGVWPSGIGEQGFPRALMLHAKALEILVAAYALLAMFAAIPALLTCTFIWRWRKFILPMVVFSLGFFVCMLIMWNVAPAGFLYWFRD